MERFTVVAHGLVSYEVTAADPAEAAAVWLRWRDRHAELTLPGGARVLQLMDSDNPPVVLDARAQIAAEVVPRRNTRSTLRTPERAPPAVGPAF
jgi:hypothetical protein